MPRGGARPGAGRPRRPATAAQVYVRLSAEEARLLTVLEARLRLTPPDVIRMALAEMAIALAGPTAITLDSKARASSQR